MMLYLGKHSVLLFFSNQSPNPLDWELIGFRLIGSSANPALHGAGRCFPIGIQCIHRLKEVLSYRIHQENIMIIFFIIRHLFRWLKQRSDVTSSAGISLDLSYREPFLHKEAEYAIGGLSFSFFPQWIDMIGQRSTELWDKPSRMFLR